MLGGTLVRSLEEQCLRPAVLRDLVARLDEVHPTGMVVPTGGTGISAAPGVDGRPLHQVGVLRGAWVGWGSEVHPTGMVVPTGGTGISAAPGVDGRPLHQVGARGRREGLRDGQRRFATPPCLHLRAVGQVLHVGPTVVSV